MRPDLSISIVNTNCKELLEPLLDSIFDKTSKITFDVYVLDNNSNDGVAVKMVRRKFPQS